MGEDGSKWKHGYIPENGAAAALKAHRKPGSKSSAKSAPSTATASEKSRTAFDAGSRSMAGRTAHRDAAKALRREAKVSNSDKVINENKQLATLHSSVANGKMTSSDARVAAARIGSTRIGKKK